MESGTKMVESLVHIMDSTVCTTAHQYHVTSRILVVVSVLYSSPYFAGVLCTGLLVLVDNFPVLLDIFL